MMLGTILALALAAGTSAAAEKPNFSGDWKMNLAKSDFSLLPPPNSITRKITHEEPSLTVVEDQSNALGELKNTRIYRTDGQPTTFTSQGAEVKSSAVWDGDVIVVDSSVESVGVKFHDRMALSSDGKTLTSSVHISSPQGDVDLVIVFERQ